MRVLALCSYPKEAAATRFRLDQFVEPLRGAGIELTIRPFLNKQQFGELYRPGGLIRKAAGILGPTLDRVLDTAKIRNYDAILVQREAMPFGPGVFEWFYQKIGHVPIILDLDDATYVRYMSPSYGRLGSYLKFFGKTDNLIRRASVVLCGNHYIGEYVESKGSRAITIPTVVDTDQFCPRPAENEVPVLGWIGTHSTFRVLEGFFPVFRRLAEKHRFKLKIVGSGTDSVDIEGVDVENLPWSLDREVADFQSLDIGLYPITVTESMVAEWIKAKSGFKAIQYFAVGIPFVMSPVGICGEIGQPGVTHINATTHDEWYDALDRLLSAPDLRAEMGAAGRQHSLQFYTLQDQAQKLAGAIRQVVSR